jgi:hypothetical protein
VKHDRVLETITFRAGRSTTLRLAPPARVRLMRRAEGAGERAESALALREEGFRALEIRVEPAGTEEGAVAVTAVRDAVGDMMEIAVPRAFGLGIALDEDVVRRSTAG